MDRTRLHPELRKSFRFVPNPPIGGPLRIRLLRELMALQPARKPGRGVHVERHGHPRGAGLRVFTPAGGGSGACLLWIHGGGMVIGGAVQDDQRCIDIAADLGILVVSVEYRLAPQHPFPTPLDDCFAGWARLLSSPELGVDPQRIVIGGQSAGGGLAASLTQRIYDEGGPQPAGQWLFCPMLDDRTAADEGLDAVKHVLWNNRSNRIGWSSYLAMAPGSPVSRRMRCRRAARISPGSPRPGSAPATSNCSTRRTAPTPKRSPTQASPATSTSYPGRPTPLSPSRPRPQSPPPTPPDPPSGCGGNSPFQRMTHRSRNDQQWPGGRGRHRRRRRHGPATAKIIGRDRHVILSDVSQQALDRAAMELEALGIASETVVCDVSDRTAVDQLVRCAASTGSIVAVVHTAGVSPQMGNAEMIMRINALGTIHVTEAFLQVAAEGFSIVNVASMAAYISPGLLMPKGAYRYAMSDHGAFLTKALRRCRPVPQTQRPGLAYSISKNFAVWYSKHMAPKFGAEGARIVSVSPGSFDTAMGRLEEKSGAAGMLRFASLQRFGKVEGIAEVLAFCASDRSGYLTGTDILCDGGVVAGITWKDLLTLTRSS